MKKRIAEMFTILMIASVLPGCGGSGTAEKAPEVSQEAEVPADEEEPAVTEEKPEKAQEAVTEVSEEKPASDNPLLNAEKVISDATNGSGQKIGEWEAVLITPDILDAITAEQLYEFANAEVDGSGFNWITLMTADGRGIQFTGSMIQLATYGTVDDQGRITEDQGTWKLSDGKYEFISAEDY